MKNKQNTLHVVVDEGKRNTRTFCYMNIVRGANIAPIPTSLPAIEWIDSLNRLRLVIDKSAIKNGQNIATLDAILHCATVCKLTGVPYIDHSYQFRKESGALKYTE